QPLWENFCTYPVRSPREYVYDNAIQLQSAKIIVGTPRSATMPMTSHFHRRRRGGAACCSAFGSAGNASDASELMKAAVLAWGSGEKLRPPPLHRYVPEG